LHHSRFERLVIAMHDINVSYSARTSRRSFLLALSASAIGTVLATTARAQRGLYDLALPPDIPKAITVYKDPDCGCCANWVKHIRAAGFVVTVRDTRDMATVKASMGVPSALESCHTARIGTYTIEGHVPADVIVKLLQAKPAAVGLAVPGMPSGSPGMEGGRVDKYDVMLFDKAGKATVFASR
jgi:hypothetical protein